MKKSFTRKLLEHFIRYRKTDRLQTIIHRKEDRLAPILTGNYAILTVAFINRKSQSEMSAK